MSAPCSLQVWLHIPPDAAPALHYPGSPQGPAAPGLPTSLLSLEQAVQNQPIEGSRRMEKEMDSPRWWMYKGLGQIRWGKGKDW